jgi:2-polyprenyl-3-methyl-5-hydroxy-6-metoxy-1,4-benzoquinol methylase
VFNLIPRPLLDTQVAFTLARAIMAGTSLGVFDALAAGPLSSEEVAAACHTNPHATQQLLHCLEGAAYLSESRGRYANTRMVKRWLVKESPHSLRDKMLFQAEEWNWVGGLETFVSTGKSVAFHDTMSAHQWTRYQDGMRAVSMGVAPEVGLRTPVPRGARDLLDIGGAHGLFSAAICNRHPGLRSTILELPQAVNHAGLQPPERAPSSHVTYVAGDALTHDLGESRYDVVLISQLVHHFTNEQNRGLAQRAARALRPGGYLVIQDFARQASAAGQLAGVTGLYFALTSTSGTWRTKDMADWQRGAGLTPSRPKEFLSMTGLVQQNARKPRPSRIMRERAA